MSTLGALLPEVGSLLSMFEAEAGPVFDRQLGMTLSFKPPDFPPHMLELQACATTMLAILVSFKSSYKSHSM